MIKRGSQTALALLLVGSMAACGDSPRSQAPAAPSSSDSEAVGSGSASGLLSPAAVASESAAPSPRPRLTPTPRERLARWSTKPGVIFDGGCSSPAATIDGSSHFHVAAACSLRIRYATSLSGKTWESSTLPTPTGHFDVDPQLAVDGTTLYLAYTRLRPIEQDTCGGRAIQEDAVGVFYRTRELPNGRWSAPTRIGHDGDHLQSLRVENGVIHETFRADDSTGDVSYASVKGSTFHAIMVPGAEATSLRIGDDGRPRIAYTSAQSLEYAVVTGGDRLETTVVLSADDVIMESPVLVLGGGDHAFVSWAATAAGEGCEVPVPSHEGTWFATDVDGDWTTKRLSKDIGAAALALDVATGRLHATYNDSRGIRYVTRAADGSWSGSRLEVPESFTGSVLRRDPATGMLLLVGSSYDEVKPGIYALTAS